MALIQLGEIISNIKGSIGGVTFSNSRNGIVAKQRLVGKRKSNTKQLNALSFSKAVVNQWNTLTNTQRDAFNSYALVNTFVNRYGVSVELTGFQWFMQLASARLYFDGTYMTTPPPHASPAALPAFDIVLDNTSMIFNWSTPIDTGSTFVYVYATPPIRGNASIQRGALRLLDVRSLDIESSFDFTNEWNTAHGLTYSDITTDGQFNINVLAFPVDAVSFVSGVGQSFTGSYSSIATGIGSMTIGSTFIVG